MGVTLCEGQCWYAYESGRYANYRLIKVVLKNDQVSYGTGVVGPIFTHKDAFKDWIDHVGASLKHPRDW